jgi:copper homeostasis protein
VPLPTRVLIEAAVETPDDATTAEAGGADRLELCSALDLGGLTPSAGTFLEIRETCRLPIVVMIRPRSGDFVYSEAEFRVMIREVAVFRPKKPAAFVFGALKPNGRVDAERCETLVKAAEGVPCVFHRAFDRSPAVGEALDVLTQLGFARVLTSGREATALAGSPVIAKVAELAGERLKVVPCGRVRADTVAQVVQITGCDEVHGSFAEPVPEEEGAGHRGYQQRVRTSRKELEKTRAALDALTLGVA